MKKLTIIIYLAGLVVTAVVFLVIGGHAEQAIAVFFVVAGLAAALRLGVPKFLLYIGGMGGICSAFPKGWISLSGKIAVALVLCTGCALAVLRKVKYKA